MLPFAVLLPWLHRKAGSWHRARGVACAGGALGTGGDEPRSTLGPDSPTFGDQTMTLPRLRWTLIVPGTLVIGFGPVFCSTRV